MVFASHGDDGQLQTKRCDGTLRLRDAANIVTVLDSVHPPSPPPASRAPDPPAPSILLASLTGGVATGEKGLAWHVAGTMHRSRLALEIRGGIAEASPVMPQDLGPISAREVAALGGISARWRRTLSSARIGAGVVTRIRCVRNCGFFDTAPEVKESKSAVGLAYSVEAGGDARRSSDVARSAPQAHSRWPCPPPPTCR